MASQMRVYVPDHPLIKHWLGVARDQETPSVLFKTAMVELGRWLTYEACRYWLPTITTSVETPFAVAEAQVLDLDKPFAIVPILRAGLALYEGAQTLLPLAKTYHLGMARNNTTFEPAVYLNRLPETFDPQTHLLLLDPMIATGGTLLAALDLITKRGIDPALIRVISIVAAPPALQKLSQAYPSLTLYSTMIDEQLNDEKYIVPGLGDAGDRAFGTT